MYIDYMQILWHFIQKNWGSFDFGILVEGQRAGEAVLEQISLWTLKDKGIPKFSSYCCNMSNIVLLNSVSENWHHYVYIGFFF